jgi:hypothetical protein
LITSIRFDLAFSRHNSPSIFLEISRARLRQKLMSFKTALAARIFRAFFAAPNAR